MNPLSSFSMEAKAIALGVLALALLGAAWGLVHHVETLGAAQAVADQAKQALAGERAARAESDRRAVAVQQKADHADQAASAARADADAARTADQRLRLRLTAAERGRAAVNSCAADPGASASAPAFVPYDVFAGVDDAAGQLGAYADKLRVSLDACIGSYEALKP